MLSKRIVNAQDTQVIYFPTLNTSNVLKSMQMLSSHLSQISLHETNIQAKPKHKPTLTTTKCLHIHLQPLNLKAIKSPSFPLVCMGPWPIQSQ
jgi:hypothetical protein